MGKIITGSKSLRRKLRRQRADVELGLHKLTPTLQTTIQTLKRDKSRPIDKAARLIVSKIKDK